MVRMLSDEGMSSRSIAPIVGATDRTVRNDVAGGKDFPPRTEFADAFVNKETGEIHDEPVKVTGMDGKQYTRRDV